MPQTTRGGRGQRRGSSGRTKFRHPGGGLAAWAAAIEDAYRMLERGGGPMGTLRGWSTDPDEFEFPPLPALDPITPWNLHYYWEAQAEKRRRRQRRLQEQAWREAEWKRLMRAAREKLYATTVAALDRVIFIIALAERSLRAATRAFLQFHQLVRSFLNRVFGPLSPVTQVVNELMSDIFDVLMDVAKGFNSGKFAAWFRRLRLAAAKLKRKRKKELDERGLDRLLKYLRRSAGRAHRLISPAPRLGHVRRGIKNIGLDA